jgi:hypothetical protein
MKKLFKIGIAFAALCTGSAKAIHPAPISIAAHHGGINESYASGAIGTGLSYSSLGGPCGVPGSSYTFTTSANSSIFGTFGLGISYLGNCPSMGGSNANYGKAELSYIDSIRLEKPSNFGSSPPDKLYVKYVLSGLLDAQAGNDGIQSPGFYGTGASIQILSSCSHDANSPAFCNQTGGQLGTYRHLSSNGSAIFDRTTALIHTALASLVQSSDPDAYVYDLYVTMIATIYGNFGSADSSFEHTLDLASVLFPDGSTPESQGYSLNFDSGIQSPNIPQPSSTPSVPGPLPVLGVAAAFGYSRKLRKRNKASKSDVTSTRWSDLMACSASRRARSGI